MAGHSPPEGPPGRSRAEKDFVLLSSPSSRLSLTALAILATILVICRFNALWHLNSAYLGGASGDGGLYVWLVQSNLRDLFRLPWFETSAFYPYGQSLAWSDNFILPSAAVGILRFLQIPEVASYNAIMLLAGLLNGWCTWRLVFALTRRMVAGLLGGTAMLCYSFLTAHLGHPQLQFFFWIPLGILTLLHTLNVPTVKRSLLVGLAVVGAFLSAVYYAVFLVLFYLAIGSAVILLRPHQFRFAEYQRILGGAALGFVPLIPFLPPYFAVMNVFGERHLYEPYYFAASIASYFSSTPLSLLYLDTAFWSHAEANLFPGFLILALAAVAFRRLTDGPLIGIATAIFVVFFILGSIATLTFLPDPLSKYLAAGSLWISIIGLGALLRKLGAIERGAGFYILTNRSLIGVFVWCAFIFYLLSLGPLGNPEKGEVAAGPFVLPYYLIPGVSAIRAAGRYGVACVFALVILASMALSHLLSKKRITVAYGLLALPILLLENFSPDYPLESKPLRGSVYDALSGAPVSNEALIVLPLTSSLTSDGEVVSWGDFARLNVEAMLDAFPTRRFLVNGYSGQRSKQMRELPRSLAGFPDERSIIALSRIVGLHYIVFRSNAVRDFNEADFSLRLTNLGGALRFLQRDASGNYLLEFLGGTAIESEFPLFLPPSGPGTLVMELRAGADNNSPPVPFELRDSDGTPLAAFSIARDGEPKTAQISLAAPVDSVRPRRLLLAVVGENKSPRGSITLLRSRFEAE